MADFTQEQVDAMLAEAKKGMFTEEDLTKKVTAEVDRRVESGIQKGLETYKGKWEEEFKTNAQLTAEELAKKELEEQSNALSSKEKEIAKKENLLEAKIMLSEGDIPKQHYEKFVEVLVSDNADVTKSNITNFINMFNETKVDITNKVKAEITKVPKPNTGTGGETVTKENFNKMPYSEKLKFKTENPDLYKQFMK